MFSRVRIGFLFLVLCTIITGCFRPGPIKIVGDYSLWTSDSKNHHIVKGTRVVVFTNVVDYEVVDKSIVGRREPSKRPDVTPAVLSERYGYFILDTETGKLTEGLTKSELESARVTFRME
jgi:hypothetical protein